MAERDDGPRISIVLVHDRTEDVARADAELRRVLDAIAAQEGGVPVEVLIVEPRGGSRPLPAGECPPLPHLRWVETDGATAYDLKNAGARAATTELVALLDADCIPRPGWLAATARAMQAHPDAAVVSGRTLYEGSGLLPRAAALIDRSYVERGRAAPTGAISNNNAVFRRATLLEHPLGNALGPFGSAAHAAQIVAAGGQLRFEPEMEVEHTFGGLGMLRSAARGMGFAIVRRRMLDSRANHGWLSRWGPAAIPLAIATWTARSVLQAIRYHRHYRVRWFELPFVWGLSAKMHGMEAEGMRRALRGETVVPGEYS